MNSSKRKSLTGRKLGAPFLTFDMKAEISRLRKEARSSTARRNAVTLVKSPKLRVVLIVMRKGGNMREHRVSGPITIFVVSGLVRFSIGPDQFDIKANGLLTLHKRIAHHIEALKESVFILTIARP